MFARAELFPLSAPDLIPPSYLLTDTKQSFAVLCFHAFTHCPICKSFVLMTIQRWGCGYPRGRRAPLLLLYLWALVSPFLPACYTQGKKASRCQVCLKQ